MRDKEKAATYFRNFIYGVEDSLVSTVGLLSGVAVAQATQSTILLTGVVLIFVEAFSMAAGSFLSEKSAEEYMRNIGKADHSHSRVASFIMFVSYFVSGFIPLAPYIFMEGASAFWSSIVLSLIALFVLGIVSSRISKEDETKSAFRMLIIGGIAIGLGALVGHLFTVFV